MARDINKLRAAKRAWYYRNKESYLQKEKEERLAKKVYLQQQKNKPCMDCKVYYPYYVMDFDHRDPLKKVFEPKALIRYSWKTLLEEVEKCDVVCSNCHRIRSYERSITMNKQEHAKT